ncbi:tape measure protein [Furfurilactobacillus milii]|uniref:tape measure protein n=1 Tax=Furfurilactobacillus milii TaxID=2888272 RepID=UPI001F30B10B|nr:tape measure protein [Furfurilactobacillus milii]
MSADYVVDQKVRWSFVDDVTSPLTRVKQLLADTTNLVNGSVSPTKVLEDAMRMLGTSGSESINKVVTDAKALQSEMTSIPKDTKLDITANAGEAIDHAKQLGTNIKELPKDTLVKVNATTEANKILDFKKNIGDVPTSHNTNLKVTDEVTEPLTHVRSAADETTKSSSKLHDVLMGTFAGSVIASGTAALLSGLHEATRAGMEYNIQQDTMRINWHNLTTEAPQDGKQLVGFINDMSQHSIYSSEALDKMAQSFYHVHSNAQETKKWTQDFVNLGSTLHVSNDALAEAGEQFAKIDAGGKANAEDMSVMINRFPMFGEALQKATGKSMDQLYQMSAQGKLTGKVFEEALDELGNKYKSSQAEALTSFQGMSMYLQSRTSMLFGDIEKSSFNMSKSALKDLQSLTSDKSMEQYANLISGGLSKVMEGTTNVLSYIAAHRKDILAVISDISEIIGILAKSIWSTVSGIVKDIASAFGLVSDSAKKSGDPLKQIESALDAILKHKSAIQEFGKILVAAFAVKKITGFISGFQDLQKAFEKTAAFSTAQKSIAAFGDTLNSTGKIFPAFGSALKAVPFTIWITAISTIVIALVELYKHNAKFRNFVNGIVDSIKQFYKDAVKWLGDAISWVRKTFGPFFNEAVKAVQSVWKQIQPIVTAGMKVVSSAIQLGIDLVVDVWKIGWGLLSTVLKVAWAVIKPIVDLGMAAISATISAVLKFIQGTWQSVWNAIASILRLAWDVMKPLVIGAMNAIADVIKLVSDIIHGRWSAVWGDIKDYFTDIWNGISGAIGGYMKDIQSVISNILSAISSVWNSMWSAMGDFFGGIWKGIKGAAQDGINGVLNVINAGVDAIDTVWQFFTDHKTSIPHMKPVKFEQGGVVHTRLSMINDGAGPNWKELLQLPSGELKMSHQRNAVMPLPVGTRVYNGDETANIMHSAGVQRYADGGIVGDAIDWTKGKLSDIGSWIGDKADAVEKFMKDPLGNISKVLHKATDGLFKGAASFGDLATGTVNKIASIAVNKFKDMLSQTQKKIESENTNGPSGPAVDRWRSVIGQATDILHHAPLSGSQIGHLLSQIATESGGDNNIVQKVWDVNMANGNPAQGLLQFIPQTFGQWAIGGHTNIKSGLDQIIAAIRRLDAMGTWNYIGQGHGWWTGGHPTTPQLAPIAEHGDEFVVNPRMGNAMQLINEAYERTVQEQPQLRDATTPSATGMHVNTANAQSDESRSDISTKLFDTIIERLTEIRDKDDDTYLDGEKVTKTTERVSAGRYRMAEAQGQA